MNMLDPTYHQLLSLAKRLSLQHRVTPELVFDPIGLILQSPLKRWDYFCTPLNSLTFASTGGDGVHFGFLDMDGSSSTPIVMTVPMADQNSFIVGENLFEFLCLGVRRGYFSLEQLAYDRTTTVMVNGEVDREMGDDEIYLLEGLQAEFGLEPWPEVENRLLELEQRYAAAIQIPDFDEWRARNGV